MSEILQLSDGHNVDFLKKWHQIYHQRSKAAFFRNMGFIFDENLEFESLCSISFIICAPLFECPGLVFNKKIKFSLG